MSVVEAQTTGPCFICGPNKVCPVRETLKLRGIAGHIARQSILGVIVQDALDALYSLGPMATDEEKSTAMKAAAKATWERLHGAFNGRP